MTWTNTDETPGWTPPAPPPSIPHQIRELAILRHGWLDGEGLAPCQAAIEAAANAWEKNVPADLTRDGRVYPVPDGNISIEWEVGTVAFSITLIPCPRSGFSGSWHAVDTSTANAKDSGGMFDARYIAEDVAQLREAIAACDALDDFEAMLDVMLEAGSVADPDFERQDETDTTNGDTSV